MPTPLPATPAPALRVPLVDGGAWDLHEQDPEGFTLVVFYRGLHCPICKSYNQTLQSLLSDYEEWGVEVIAVSMDGEERAEESVRDWDLDALRVGYGLSEEAAQNWGLYLSSGVQEAEPERFSEPGLFLVRPDGTLYYAAVNSMPFGRPDLEDLLQAVDFIQENDYPPRGEVAVRRA